MSSRPRGYKAPNFFLNQQGFPIDKHFVRAQTTGSHENAILALAAGTVDAALNWWNAENDSNLTRMLNKGMLKNADGSPMKREDFRIAWKSPLLPGSPFTYLADLPAEMRKAISQAFIAAPDQGQGRLRQAVRRQGRGLCRGRRQGL